jgi:hypothetical protein
LVVWAKTVKKLVARPRISSGASICTTVRRMVTLMASASPKTPTAIKPSQNHLEIPKNPKLKAKSNVAAIDSAPLRLMSPKASNMPEPIRAPIAGAA